MRTGFIKRANAQSINALHAILALLPATTALSPSDSIMLLTLPLAELAVISIAFARLWGRASRWLALGMREQIIVTPRPPEEEISYRMRGIVPAALRSLGAMIFLASLAACLRWAFRYDGLLLFKLSLDLAWAAGFSFIVIEMSCVVTAFACLRPHAQFTSAFFFALRWIGIFGIVAFLQMLSLGHFWQWGIGARLDQRVVEAIVLIHVVAYLATGLPLRWQQSCAAYMSIDPPSGGLGSIERVENWDEADRLALWKRFNRVRPFLLGPFFLASAVGFAAIISRLRA